jgi:hypothetical protein
MGTKISAHNVHFLSVSAEGSWFSILEEFSKALNGLLESAEGELGFSADGERARFAAFGWCVR